MGKRSDDKQFADVRRVLDAYMAMIRRQNQIAVKSASASRRTQTGGINVVLYSKNGRYNQVQVAYPSPNSYYDSTALSLLYIAYDLHKKGDLISDLFDHVRKQLEAAQGTERLYLQLALGYLH